MKHLYIHVILPIIALLSHSTLAAQQPTQSALRFTATTYDYGHIGEDGGSVLCSFDAINTGGYEVEVINIVTTCGCTSAIYEQRTIAPGGSFRFEVRYDPMNRPGRIDKQILVYTSDSEAPTTLRIAGYVQPRQRSTEELYPFNMGYGLRLRSNFHAFGYVEHGKSVETHIECINNGTEDIAINIIPATSSGLLSIDYPTVLAPHATADITLRYSLSEDCHIYGTLYDTFKVLIDGIEAQYELSAQVVATDNFDIVDDISAPRADISKNIIKFGDVKVSDGVLHGTTTISNGGNTPLIIRRVESSSTAVECHIEANTTLQAGETMEVEVELHTSRIEVSDYPFVARVRLITNDPTRPMQTLRVSAIPVD